MTADKDALLRECLPCIAVAAKVAADNGQAFLAGSRIDLESRITAALEGGKDSKLKMHDPEGQKYAGDRLPKGD